MILRRIFDCFVICSLFQATVYGQEPLAPAAAHATLKTPDDLAVDLVLHEPTITQPVFLNFDQRGRMWVVQYRQYPHPAGLKIVSTDQYYRNVYNKIPPAPPNHDRGADIISIHEDTNGDGKYDKHKVFLEGLNMATSVTVGRGGVWVLQPPYLLFYPDADGDDVPDGDPVVHLKGFWLEDTHSIANSLRWGPDGWLYGCQGSTVSSDIEVVGKPGPSKPLHSLGQLIWRYHPEQREFEIWAEGGGNAFGLEMDSKGRIFSGHNGGDTRGFHYPQHGYLRKGFTKHGPLSNPYAFGFFPHMPHNKVQRFTHNFVIYEGAALPKKYHGQLFGSDPLNKNIPIARVTPDGATFRTQDIGYAITTEDAWFRPVDIKVGPDGAVYVCDWYDQQLAHTKNHEGHMDRDRGRIYRIRARDAEPTRAEDHGAKTSTELVELLRHPNRWHREIAHRLLADRRDPQTAHSLKRAFQQTTGQFALESLWAINLSGGFDDDFALQALRHDDPYVRTWTVRLLGDRNQMNTPVADALIRLAQNEPHVEVRSQLASSSRRLTATQALPIVRALLRYDADTKDRYLPLLDWWALEARCADNAAEVLKLFEDQSIWNCQLVRDHILRRLMRRFASTNRREDYLRCARLLELSPDKEASQKLLSGLELAWSGRLPTGIPRDLIDQMSAAGGGSLRLRVRQQQPTALAEALQAIANEKSDPVERADLIALLGEANFAAALTPLLDIVGHVGAPSQVRAAAITALGHYDADSVPQTLLQSYGDLSSDQQRVALSVLVSRPAWAKRLLAAISEERIDRLTVPLEVIRHCLLHDDARLREMIAATYGKVDASNTAEMKAEIARLKGVVSQLKGSPYDGKPLFQQHCGKCHELFGNGGGVGPDLTAYQRTDLDRMLQNIINPSREIREGFENYSVFTEDGRVVSGLIVDQDANVVVVRGADGQTQNIPRSEIDEMNLMPQSLMPLDILRPLSEAQIQHLFAYLRSTQPLNN